MADKYVFKNEGQHAVWTRVHRGSNGIM